MALGSDNRLRQLPKQYGDPLLTCLAILLLVLMFVVAPLQAGGLIIFQHFGFAVALAMIIGVLIMSGSPTAFVVMLIAIGMNAAAAVLRLSHQSELDLYLVAGAWLIMAITLSIVVARAVFAPGRVNTIGLPARFFFICYLL